MAKNTDITLRNKMIYQVFPRQYSKSANLKGVTNDLDRIQKLGCDILYLLPIHPIGVDGAKGSLGCPYSIQNYREVDPMLGTMDDLIELINETHQRGMKIIIDVVYNHTSRDSFLLKTHPEYFYRNTQGKFANKAGDWADVYDLDYSNHDLWVELIDTLKGWVKKGIDGFRCDVASLVPLEFWKEAKEALEEINPEVIFLAESVHNGFVKYVRDLGFDASSDCDLYQAFDIEYDYDIIPLYHEYLKTGKNLNLWLTALLEQEGRYPKNYVKSHCLENHDIPRAAQFIKDASKLRNLNALIFFLKGIAFVYEGQEACDSKLESLFDIDPVDFSTLNQYGMADLISKLSQLKKDPLFASGRYNIHLETLEVAHISYESDLKKLVLVANLGNEKGSIKVELPDGEYESILEGDKVTVKDGLLMLVANPIAIKVKK